MNFLETINQYKIANTIKPSSKNEENVYNHWGYNFITALVCGTDSTANCNKTLLKSEILWKIADYIPQDIVDVCDICPLKATENNGYCCSEKDYYYRKQTIRVSNNQYTFVMVNIFLKKIKYIVVYYQNIAVNPELVKFIKAIEELDVKKARKYAKMSPESIIFALKVRE